MGTQDTFNLIGNTIARTFRVDEVVAEGGFGVVYRAFHLHFRAPVALKCLKIPRKLSAEEGREFLEQFRVEAEIQFRLSARLPAIVRPLHVDALQTNDGRFVPFMALEWLEGKSLEEVIERRTFEGKSPLSLKSAMDLIAPAVSALHEAHHFETPTGVLSIVHRDIKPDNLFLTETGSKSVIKILDFGISKIEHTATQLIDPPSHSSERPPFSPAYGAPEQWVPEQFGQTGPWTDVWGLALTLAEMIKGNPIVSGDLQAMMSQSLNPHRRPTPRTEDVLISDAVEDVFLNALALDPRQRYQSVRAFWLDLEHANLSAPTIHHKLNETPSGRRMTLPPMSAPTPWRAPLYDDQTFPAPSDFPATEQPWFSSPVAKHQSDPRRPSRQLLTKGFLDRDKFSRTAGTYRLSLDKAAPSSATPRHSAPPVPPRVQPAPLTLDLQPISSFPAAESDEQTIAPSCDVIPDLHTQHCPLPYSKKITSTPVLKVNAQRHEAPVRSGFMPHVFMRPTHASEGLALRAQQDSSSNNSTSEALSLVPPAPHQKLGS